MTDFTAQTEANAIQVWHGSRDRVLEILDAGCFGGIFGAGDKRAALSHGDVLHIIDSPRHLTNFVLNYQIEGVYEIALDIVRGDAVLADAILDPGCPTDDPDPEVGLELQRLRGLLAARLGYTSVEMADEHGTTYLCLPGCSIRLATDDDR
jgi:hypothetical protein